MSTLRPTILGQTPRVCRSTVIRGVRLYESILREHDWRWRVSGRVGRDEGSWTLWLESEEGPPRPFSSPSLNVWRVRSGGDSRVPLYILVESYVKGSLTLVSTDRVLWRWHTKTSKDILIFPDIRHGFLLCGGDDSDLEEITKHPLFFVGKTEWKENSISNGLTFRDTVTYVVLSFCLSFWFRPPKEFKRQ